MMMVSTVLLISLVLAVLFIIVVVKMLVNLGTVLFSRKRLLSGADRLVRFVGWIFLLVGGVSFYQFFVRMGIMEGFWRYRPDPAPIIVLTIFSLLFFVVGLRLVAMARKLTKKKNRYRKYIAVVANQHVTSIQGIADAIPTTYGEAVAELEEMIKKGYFSQMVLDKNAGQIYHIDLNKPAVFAQNAAPAVATAPAVTMRTTSCKGCGATVAVSGASGTCEYCGSVNHI